MFLYCHAALIRRVPPVDEHWRYEMLQIAGGILIAVFVLVFLQWILRGAAWAILISLVLVIAIVGWIALAETVGEQWAAVIVTELGGTALAWFGAEDDEPPSLLRLLLCTCVPPLLVLGLGLSIAALSIVAVIVVGAAMLIIWFCMTYLDSDSITSAHSRSDGCNLSIRLA
jgi:hypothetical protein